MSKEYAKDYTVEELMTVRLAHELRDGEVGFVGMGTGGRAFTLAVGIPLAAVGLAQLTHAPDFIIQSGSFTNPKLTEVPASKYFITDRGVIDWRAEAFVPVYHPFELFKRGKIDVGFVSGAQVDKYGNLNITVIGDYHKPKVRLIGTLLQTEHLTLARRGVMIIIDHEKRSFVEKVNYITAPGFIDGYDSRERAGLTTPGPWKVFTNKAILGFDARTKRMKLETVHPGVTVEEVQANTGFDLMFSGKAQETERPTVEEVSLLRNKVDPRGVLLREGS